MLRKSHIQIGAVIEPRELVTIHSQRFQIPDRQGLVHLQFRRFAGCPVCNLHLQSVVRRYQEIVAASVKEVVVFHSTAEALLPHTGGFPFAVVADPDKLLYAAFGVESAPRALLDPRAWIPVLRGISRSLIPVLRGEQPLPALNPHGGRLGLPADFLIAGDGEVLACKYGSHVYDQWPVDEILALAAANSVPTYRDLSWTRDKRSKNLIERIPSHGRRK